jgi:hypothetical protein
LLRKKFAITVLLALALLPAFVFLNQTFAQTTDPQKQKAETLLAILEETNTTIVSTFKELENKNITSPEAQTTYTQGLVKVNESLRLVAQDNFDEACTEAVLAMQKFEETLKLLEASPSDSNPTTTEMVTMLRANIARAVTYIEKLENMTARAKDAGYNTLSIENQIAESRGYLRNAAQKLRVLNLEGATEDLCEAKEVLDDLIEHVTQLINRVSESNAQRYLQAAEDRVLAAKARISVSATLTPKEKEEALTALDNSETKLDNAKDLIQANNVDDAIQELEEAKKWEESSNTTANAVSVTPSNSADVVEKLPTTRTIDSN